MLLSLIVKMASPRILFSKLATSPKPLRKASKLSQCESPRTPKQNLISKQTKAVNYLSPFNIDTPNRIKLLHNGLPEKHYNILGSGGFGTVYKATYKGDEVALKVMAENKKTNTIITSEKHACALRHPNIIKILSIEEGSALSLVTMELCGLTLQDRLDKEQICKEERLCIWKDVAYALQFCHNAGVIHADVKPKNILISANGQPKLADFGNSILKGESCRCKNFHGTPGYAAPEVLRGNIPTSMADVYSLGIVAWQMISRETPFSGSHTHVIIYSSVKGKRPEDEHLNDGFFGKYKALYRKMWSQEPEDRPTLANVINNLETLIS